MDTFIEGLPKFRVVPYNRYLMVEFYWFKV